MKAAELILSEVGLEGFTMTTIAHRAEVSVGGLYRRFADKQELLHALKDRVLSRLEEKIASEMQTSPPKLDEVVNRFIKELSRHFSANALVWNAFFMPAAQDSKMTQRGADGLAQMYQEFRAAALSDREHIAHKNAEHALSVTFEMVSAPIIRRTIPVARINLPTFYLDWDEFSDQLVQAGLAYLKTPK